MSQKNILRQAVKELLESFLSEVKNYSVDNFLKTNVDPFRFAFNAALWGEAQTIKMEIEHKLAMKLENMIGKFHEDYLGNAIHLPTLSQWEKVTPGKIPGIDIVNKKLNIYLQLKSKHNSMNSSSSGKLRDELESLTKTLTKPYTVGCGWVIASPKKKCIGEDKISSVGSIFKGKALYEYITGDKDEMDTVMTDFTTILSDEIKTINMLQLVERSTKKVFDDLTMLAKSDSSTIAEYLYNQAVG
ncbi:MAG: Eco47II family restriction endonuclease [Candidatus Hydrogenedens sp.]|nr:Eco47II family restriction endonuclease [Candidatus Hydrogenedens sp.]